MRYRVRLELLDGRKVTLHLDDDRRVTSAPPSLFWTLYHPWEDVCGEVVERCCCVVLGEEEIP